MATAEYTPDTEAGELRWLPIGQIIPAEDNPRQALTDLEGLAASIRAVGLLTPVIVEDGGGGTYRLVAGHRRLAAAQIAGLAELPALVRSFDPLSRQAARLVENGQRVNLTPMEEAAAYQHLLSLDVDAEALATSVGRPRAEVDGRLAVFALPASIHRLLAEEALSYPEALLLTEVAEYPEDIDTALARCEKWGWTVGQAVEHVRKVRRVSIKAGATREKLTRQKVAIIDTPEHGYLTGNHTARPLGGSWGGVPITRAVHKKEPCHAAYVGHDGTAVYVCLEPARHRADQKDGAGNPVLPDRKAERAAKRAANKARRQAAADRVTAVGTLLRGEGDLGLADYLLGAVLDHAPREILPAAARLLGLDVPDGQTWSASEPADAALRAYAGRDTDASLRVAVAVHFALAERDASAEYQAFRGGAGVIAYTDLLVMNGYVETAGDAADRDRYRGRAVAGVAGESGGESQWGESEPEEE